MEEELEGYDKLVAGHQMEETQWQVEFCEAQEEMDVEMPAAPMSGLAPKETLKDLQFSIGNQTFGGGWTAWAVTDAVAKR